MVIYSSKYSDYTLRSSIGFGAASTVYSAQYDTPSPPGELISSRTNPYLCAIKISSRQFDVNQWHEEVRLLSSCRHPNVLQIFSAFTLPPDHFQVAIVTPLIVGGSLLSIMAWRASLQSDEQPTGLFRSLSSKGRSSQDRTLSKGKLIEEEIKAVLVQVLNGLGYLHSQGIIHRDIKAGNILIDANGTILLADLGIGLRSKLYTDSESKMELVGSPCWIAPEIILGEEATYKSDVWGLGITLIELSTGSAPLSNLMPAKILSQIAMAPPPTLPPACEASKPYLAMLNACLIRQPSSRADVPQLQKQPFLRNARKVGWLAEALLGNVPPLADRQEIHRVPSHHSLRSLASSWNFNPTPSGSTMTTPIRTSHRLPRSPSTSTSASGQSHFLNPVIRRRRSVSRSSVGYSVPPSPEAGFSRLSRAGWVKPYGGDIISVLPGQEENLGRARTRSLSPSPSPGLRDRTIESHPTNIIPVVLHTTPIAEDDRRQPLSDISSSVPAAPTPIGSPMVPLATAPVMIEKTVGVGPGASSPEKPERKGLFARRRSMKVEGSEEESRLVRTLKGLRSR